MLAFSTLRHDQIDLNKSKSSGVRDLKRFLQFAELGEEAFKRELAVELNAEFDSPFEAEVAAELEGRGWTVHRQVGCSGYRIDLAVVDREHPGRYLLGIECDGASYHSAPTARDRDKLRQGVLEDLGWRLHRIWSTDWWENRERVVSELVAAIDGARARPEPLVEPEPPRHSEANAWDVEDAPAEEPDEAPREDVPEAERPSHPDPLDREPTGPRRYASLANEPSSTIDREGPIEDSPPTPAGRVQRVLEGLPRVPSSGVGGPRLELYRATPLRTRGWQESFYEDAESLAIAEALRDVVRIEAPILEHVATRRIGELWGFQRMKAKAAARVARCIAKARVHVGNSGGGERVLWAAPECEKSYCGARVPDEADERTHRPITDVPLVELVELLRFWIDEAGPMSERDLFEHANRTLGFKSLGAKIRARLDAALRFAEAKECLEVRDSIVRIASK